MVDRDDRADPPSKILLDELFASEDARFLSVFTQFDSYVTLKHFTSRWLSDGRPWARRQLIEYLHSTLNYPGHEVVFKRVFKHAEASRDDELMAVLAVSLDALVRRTRVSSFTYDYRSRQSFRREYLLAKPNKTVIDQRGRFDEYTYRGKTHRYPLRDILNRPNNRLFSQKTRSYLRRRVWRYFRFMAYKDPDRYVDAMIRLFALYRDDHFATGEGILDNWTLMHAAFHHANEIDFTVAHTNLAAGRSLATLSASPYRPQVWKTPKAAEKLWRLLSRANSQLIRLWAIDGLRDHHAEFLKRVEIEQLIPLLSAGNSTVAEFSMDLFLAHPGLSNVTITKWLALLDSADFSVVPLICEAMKRHIDPDRLESDQLVSLTCAAPASVSAMGFSWTQQRHARRRLSTVDLGKLSSAQCVASALQIATWAIDCLASDETNSDDEVEEQLIQFFDASVVQVRDAACTWLQKDSIASDADHQFRTSASLWVKIAETPYDNVRFALVVALGKFLNGNPDARTKLSVTETVRVYVAVILCVDRGSRAKPKAIRGLGRIDLHDSKTASVVLRALAMAAKSVRAPERYAAIAELASIVDRHAELADEIAGLTPQIDWSPASAGAI